MKQRYLADQYVFNYKLRETVGNKWIYASTTGNIEIVATFYIDGSIILNEKVGRNPAYTVTCR
jgi:hypothetical protein